MKFALLCILDVRLTPQTERGFRAHTNTFVLDNFNANCNVYIGYICISCYFCVPCSVSSFTARVRAQASFNGCARECKLGDYVSSVDIHVYECVCSFSVF